MNNILEKVYILNLCMSLIFVKNYK